MKRIKLFSNSRRKLFSDQELRRVVCADCGCEMETAENVGKILCPECGGKRFNIKLFGSAPKKDVAEDPVKESELEIKLKRYSGQTISKTDFEKTFSNHTDLVEKGFASLEGNNATIWSGAYEAERMFSKIIFQVTKVMDLDDDVMHSHCPKIDVINKLAERHALPEKSILILKKAHNLNNLPLVPEEVRFSETWVEDSKIIPDLKLEYGGERFGIKQFMDILHERYPDAPEDIIDTLTSKGVIEINDNQVRVAQ